jgi:AAA domain
MGKGMSIFAPDQKCSKPMSAQRHANAAAAKEPKPLASGNGASSYLSPTEFSRRTGHDPRVEDARAIRIEDELARRGIKLRGGVDRCGPCPQCGGDDRYSINVKDQVFNCRGCGAKGHGAIDLVMFLDGSDFKGAIETLAGEPRHAAAPARERAQQPKKSYFDYHDAHGALVYQVERTDYYDGRKKTFRQRRPDPARPGEWLWKLGDVRPVPYHLPDLLKGLENWDLIVIAEGERCVDLLREWGFVATCNSGGYGNRAIWAKHAEYFSKAKSPDVLILPDNDDQGRDHTDTVAAHLKEAGARVRVLELPGLGPKGDIIDWEAAGGTREQLDALIESDARPWVSSEAPPRESVNAEPARPLKGEQEPRKITASPFVWRDPKMIPRREFLYGKFYARKFISTMIAAGGIGKSSLALVEAIAMVTGRPLLGVPVPKRLRVWYWNGEDPKEETERRIAAILLHFKIPPAEIEGWLFTDSGRETPICIAEPYRDGVIFGPDAKALSEEITAKRIDVFILDPFVKTHGVSENINGAIDLVARKYAGIADEADCAIGLAHHVRKATGNGRAEVTIDDARGAGSLVDAARSNRVLNVMTEDEATAAQVKPEQRKSYFRADDGKANMAPPAENATWFKIVSIGLGNHEVFELGDFVGVVASWALPDVFVGVTTDDLPKVQAAIDGGSWAKNAGAEDWAGYAIAKVLEIDLDDGGAKVRVTKLLKAWLKSKALAEELRPDPKRAWRKRPTIIVGVRAT